MDTRKLKFKALDHGAHVIDNHGRVIGSLNWVNDAEELVTRWNAYPDLIAQRDELLAALKGVEAELKTFGFIGKEGVSANDSEYGWLWSPAAQAMQEAIANASK